MAKKSRTTAKERAKEKRELSKRDVANEHKATGYRSKKGMSEAEAAAHHYHENRDEIEARRAERADAKARAAWLAHETPRPQKEFFRRAKGKGKGKLWVRLTVTRPITPKSKHWGQEDLPF